MFAEDSLYISVVDGSRARWALFAPCTVLPYYTRICDTFRLFYRSFNILRQIGGARVRCGPSSSSSSSLLLFSATLDAILYRIIMYCSFRVIFLPFRWSRRSFQYYVLPSPNNNMIVLLIFPASYANVSFSLLILLFRIFFFSAPVRSVCFPFESRLQCWTASLRTMFKTEYACMKLPCRKPEIHANHLHSKYADRAPPHKLDVDWFSPWLISFPESLYFAIQ